LKDGVPFTAGAFTTGKYPFMMFGLPAAAFAIYKNKWYAIFQLCHPNTLVTTN
jgi:hypothetical protein